MCRSLATAAVICLTGFSSLSGLAAPVREDFRITSDHGLQLAVRQVSDYEADRDRGPLLLVHGARVGAIPSFDVDIPGFSLAKDLAAAGHTVYLVDVRGYGRSDFPPSMAEDRFSSPPAVPTADATADLKRTLDEIANRHPGQPLSALGWATGSHWLAATEAAFPGSIDRLVFHNSVYGGQGPWPLAGIFSESDDPSRFDYAKFGAYRLSDANSLVGRWTEAEGISQDFIDRYVELSMEGDSTSDARTPPSFRHPSGPIADTLEIVYGGPIYDAGRIEADILILRSGDDFWSRPVDVTTMKADLTNAASVTAYEMPGVSHYVHLEPGEARERFLTIVTDFTADGALDRDDAS